MTDTPADDQSTVESIFLESAMPTPPGYDALAIYKDFRQLFFGSDLGRKVLVQILRMAHTGRASAVAGGFDTNRTFFHDGERNLANRIVITSAREPQPLPARLTTRKPLEK